MTGILSPSLRICASMAAIGLVTFVAFRVVPVNATTVSLLYLFTVLLIARNWGLAESGTASFVATACLNFFFLPPVLHFSIADAQNWVALFAFLATAVVVSQLSTLARLQTQSAIDRQQEMERLYALSRNILLSNTSESVAKQVAAQVAQAFNFAGVSLYERSSGEIYRAGVADLRDWDDRLREVALQGIFLQDPATGTVVTAIRLGSQPIGSIALRGVMLPDSALQSVANLIAIDLERSRSIDAANRADVARQSEKLKSTLLDAVAHEFKTPLTSIRAAASALREDMASATPYQKELATIVDEEAAHLGRLVSEAIQMAQIEAGRVHLRRRLEPLREIVVRVLGSLPIENSGHTVATVLPEDLPPVNVDPELIELALRLVVDNAMKYSPANSPITVKAHHAESRLVIGVRSEGPGIPEAEQSKIFTKFYRPDGPSRQIPGTGMGLSIAREIVQAHQGQIWVESAPGIGAEFCISLPLAAMDVSA